MGVLLVRNSQVVCVDCERETVGEVVVAQVTQSLLGPPTPKELDLFEHIEDPLNCLEKESEVMKYEF